MSDELTIISPDELTVADAGEIDLVIDSIISSSHENMDVIAELALQSTALLTAADSRSKALSSQGFLESCWKNFTGENKKLQNAVMQDTLAAQYAAQSMMNRILDECISNRQLTLAVNYKLNQYYRELKQDWIQIAEEQNLLANDVHTIRRAIVAFYQQSTREMVEHRALIDALDCFESSYCPKCGHTLAPQQIVCPKCGEIHQLKVKQMPARSKKKLENVSAVVQKPNCDAEIRWSKEAGRIAAEVSKIQELIKLGNIPGCTDDLRKDLNHLLEQCRSAEFQIAIVGDIKAGKSMLMNALMGTEIASVGINPETAALTKFRSADGFQLKVRFHNKKQWVSLNESARKAKGAMKHLLSQPEIPNLVGQWVNHPEYALSFQTIEELRDEVFKWTSAKSAEHLFVSEVEVGIDRSVFDMPSEVVFVDTPGLHDPVPYRSDITKTYIREANAVLIVVKCEALSTEKLKTITSVLDVVGSKKRKAYIIATQKDKLNSPVEECNQVLEEWVRLLLQAKCFKSEREARSHIITSSAYIHLCLKQFRTLSDEESDDPEKFSDEKYNNLQNYASKVLTVGSSGTGRRRTYDINQLKRSGVDSERLYDDTSIHHLRRELENSLISQYRKEKLKDLRREYRRCSKEIKRLVSEAASETQSRLDAARLGASALTERRTASKRKLASAKEENAQMRKKAAALQKRTDDLLSKL